MTGLPPTPEEIAQYRRSVDNLLSAADSLTKNLVVEDFEKPAPAPVSLEVGIKMMRRSADNLLMAADLV